MNGEAYAAKRLVDVVVGGVALLVLAPLLLVTAAMIALTMGRPILFRQERAGLHGRSFHIFKFRTMRPPAPGRELLDDPHRVTRIGRLLRTSSIDELPGLFNVLRGEMSLVGPRPLLPEYLVHYSPEQARRHDVRPGLTGLAQVGGRNLLSWEEKFVLDVDYVERASLRLDVRIAALTVQCLLRRRGAQAASIRFVGSEPLMSHEFSTNADDRQSNAS